MEHLTEQSTRKKCIQMFILTTGATIILWKSMDLMILMECEHRIADQVHLLEEGKHLLKNGYSRIETQWEFAALENELKGHQRSSNGAILSDHDK